MSHSDARYRSEEISPEVVKTLDRFEKISGLRVNKEKTQMLRIGKDAKSDPILCEDLGLQWVNRLSILGIKLSANPDETRQSKQGGFCIFHTET